MYCIVEGLFVNLHESLKIYITYDMIQCVPCKVADLSELDL